MLSRTGQSRKGLPTFRSSIKRSNEHKVREFLQGHAHICSAGGSSLPKFRPRRKIEQLLLLLLSILLSPSAIAAAIYRYCLCCLLLLPSLSMAIAVPVYHYYCCYLLLLLFLARANNSNSNSDSNSSCCQFLPPATKDQLLICCTSRQEALHDCH